MTSYDSVAPVEGIYLNIANGKIDGQDLKIFIDAALTWLKTNQQIVNALNVFPVPDGDTGTNMVLTMQAAQNEILSSRETNVGKMAHILAQGALMGARGNSGVILSQLLRGFARALDNLETMDAPLLVKACIEARNTAYKGVVRPVEGTILTVAKDVAAEAELAILETQDLLELLKRIVKAADVSVKHTPELLPILKQANVVDSGGKGLFYLLDGILRFIQNQSLENPEMIIQPLSAIKTSEAMESIEPGQDYEVVIDFQPQQQFNLDNYYQGLSQMGTSIQVGEGDGMYRMHIHVPEENRYTPIDFTLKQGTITKVFIENLVAQMEENIKGKNQRIETTHIDPGQIAVIAVSPGFGISRIFASLGAAAIVDGGQTMNPSTEEILKAFEDLPTDKVIVLPNNKNIVMAAMASTSASVKHVAVIPSLSIPQGLSAMLHLTPDGDFDQVVENMKNSLQDVETAEITVATRNATINDIEVKEGEVIGLLNGKLIFASNSIVETCLSLLNSAKTDEKERITLFYGDNVKISEVDQIAEKIQAVYPSHEIEIHEGGQPHYKLIIAVE